MHFFEPNKHDQALNDAFSGALDLKVRKISIP